MKTALFTKTYEGDFPWLGLLAQTIDKFAKNFECWYVVLDSGCRIPNLKLDNIDVIYVFADVPDLKEAPCPFAGHPGLNTVQYNFQQVVKMQWYKYTNSNIDAVLQIDSDCIITDYIYPDSTCVQSIPCWLKARWDDETIRTWKNCMNTFTKEPFPEYHYMIASSFLLTRYATLEFNKWVFNQHQIPFEEFAMHNQCTEYNFFGWFLDNKGKFGYTVLDRDFIHTSLPNQHIGNVKKYWSWSLQQLAQATADVKQILW